ncbi:hypothetical protein ACSCB1_02625 [Streptomyces europaeiscabiei]|uniref:Tetratricopeptide repeat protein n=2 Tax=Streptomyces europaeiscabiei TaxID=146819 RepID=A0ABU4NWW6_9ACTN|nr:hypothetical protein [Streptomyces europaeiscabiei]MDX2524693.1 hypothetical protein [Streptomyces europaeiscabiei]MDX3550050.1 hypothetical protein [Streptomyces europaeiscabiei]MDX3559242.1 hypothetical protein [Streptomyces europaeiscabiei]MDX3707276.1 hypothetical protein [Streptomyces europaeiscabiei]MDX3715826.1 hypothetical protein [Streptomyces europaeiscabiei]
MTIDHDAVLRARVLLLGSGRPSRAELVGAYRVLAEVSPKAYMPKLVDALLALRYESRDPKVDLALAAEASRAARRIEVGAPNRAERLHRALDAYQASLFALGHRAEGRAICEELAEAGRSEPLASVLAEEGHFREAAKLDEEAARNGIPEHSFWNMVQWAANLEGAGLHDAASAVFRELLEETRRKAAEQRTALAILTWELVHFSRMREAVGDEASAGAARREALSVLEELATTGEPKNWSCILGWWRTLFVLSGRAAEPAASPESPMPPFGTELRWSRDVRDGFLGMLPGLEAEAARLREADRLPELVDVQRRIGIRTAVREGDHPHLFKDRFTPSFDEGVTLARRLPDNHARLARALTDRSMFLVAARSFEPAHADFAEAVALLHDR